MHWYYILGIAALSLVLGWVDFVLAREIKPAFERLRPLPGLLDKIGALVYVGLLPVLGVIFGIKASSLSPYLTMPASLALLAWLEIICLLGINRVRKDTDARIEMALRGGFFGRTAAAVAALTPKSRWKKAELKRRTAHALRHK